MKSNKTVALILSIVFFVCALALTAVCVYILSNSQDVLALFVGSVVFDLIFVLTLLCFASAVALLLSAIRKMRPVAIAMYSAGALFVAVPSLVYFSYVVSQSGVSEGFLFILCTLIGSALAILAGIFTCVFASRLHRFMFTEIQPEITEEAPAAEVETEEPVVEEQK